MIHKILNWLIGSTWEERKEKERKTAWREARRKHWYSKITKQYWLEQTGYEEPPDFLMFALYSHKRQARFNKRMEKYFDKIIYDACFADVERSRRKIKPRTVLEEIDIKYLANGIEIEKPEDTHTNVE